MKRFEFDSSQVIGMANDNLKNGPTRRGALELYPDFQQEGYLSLDIRGPVKAFRGCAVIDKATARKLGAALLGWAMGAGEVGQVTGRPEAGYHPGSLADPRD